MGYSNVRVPAIAVSVNGLLIDGVVDLDISKNSFLGADRYRLSVALGSSDYDVWATTAIEIEISLGVDGEWESFIRGPVDRVSLDVENRLVHVEGRDLTARFLETRIQETFENQTASDIAVLLASRQGLSAKVTPTNTLVGREFAGDCSRTTLDQHSSDTTDWDLLVRLASLEGYDVWVDGNTLNFSPPILSPAPTLITPKDCQSLHLERSLNLSNGLQVVVKSWDCRTQTVVSQVARSSNMSVTGRTYVVVRPNLSQAAASTLATRLLAEMSQNARVIRLERPGTLLSRPRQSLVLAETGTAFDSTYVVTSVETHLSYTHGFTETIEAKVPPWTAF